MRTIAMVSQKGGAGKTTLSLHLAVAAQLAGLSVAIVDLDPQSSAWRWSERRKEPPQAITATADQLEHVKDKAAGGGLDLLIFDSAPHADRPALMACRAADLVLIPCRASIVDIDAIGATADLAMMAQRPSTVVFNAASTTTEVDLAQSRQGLRARGVALYSGAIHQRVAFSRTLIGGRTAQEIEPGGRAAQEIDALFGWAMGQLGVELPRAAA